jgi:alpha-glucosidase
LNLYRKIIALRGSEKALREGKYVELNGGDPNVLAFARQDAGGETVIVALNMSESQRSVKLELSKVAAPSAKATTLVSSGAKTSEDRNLTLEPYGIYVAKVDSRLR